MRRARLLGPAFSVILGASLLASPPAAAQAVSPTLKGTIGCGLIGGELPLMVMSIVGVDNGWILAAGGVLGATGGALGGFFYVEEQGAELAVGSLVLGMALAIPTLGLIVNATAYRPDDGDSFIEPIPEDDGEGDVDADANLETGDGGAQGGFSIGGSTEEGGGGDDAGAGGGAAPERQPPRIRLERRSPVGSLLRFDAGQIALAVPTVAVLPAGPSSGTVVSMSLASGTF